MRSVIWRSLKGHSYSVFLAREPYDSRRQSIIFRREDGHVAVNSVDSWRDLRDIDDVELTELLERAETVD